MRLASLSSMRLLRTVLIVLMLAACENLRVYMQETAGITPKELIPLYAQEKQYVEDRNLVAKVKGALAAEPALRGTDIEVDVYLREVTLKGVVAPQQAAKALEITRAVPGVKSVKQEFK